MEDWRISDPNMIPEGWSITYADPPGFVSDELMRCQTLCAKNECGRYGTNWGCAPGWDTHMDVLGERFDSAILLEKRFDVDPSDKDEVRKASLELSRTLRAITASMRSEGLDCIGFAGGECDYCGVCAYPEKCRFPEQLVPSISALGIDLGNYLSGLGKGFCFEKDSLALYGLVLFRK